MRNFLAILFISCFFLCSVKLIEKKEEIYWSKDRKLTWEDFKGTPDPKAPYKAFTVGGFGCTGKPYGDSCRITISTHFLKHKSWIKNGSENDRLLGHEQTHFDIIELFARRTRKEILEKKFKKQSFNSEIALIFKVNNTKKNSYQTLYDKETEHSVNLVKQQQWNEKIQNELLNYESYKDSVIIVKIDAK
jgi:hypothetical protein